jgi:hypothetical protein
LGVDPTDDACEFRGGLRQGWLNANYPLAVLRASSAHLSLSIRGGSFLMDPVQLDREDVVAVRSMRGLLSRGLRFDTVGGSADKVIFWTLPRRHDVVREALRSRGWPVR